MNSHSRIRIAVLGAEGRMGKSICGLLAAHATLELGVAIDAGGDLSALDRCQAAIDFTVPVASVFHADEAAKRGLPLVIGTTGLTPEQEREIAKAALSAPILYSANMSVGVNLLAALVEQAAARLGLDYDIEIAEMHHRNKIDAPSGTALMLGRAAAKGRDVQLDSVKTSGRDGLTGKRPAGEIGFATLRGGDVAGEHTVYFAGDGERLELTHRATSRVVFAQGALRAAEWLVRQKAGLYSMRDVLNIG